MSAGTYKIWCEQGATFNLFFTWQDSNGTPYNLTNMTARMQVRESKKSPTAIITLTSQNGDIILGGTAGTISVNIAASQTANLIPAQYVYDLEVVNSAIVTRLIEGAFVVDGEVTK